MGQRLITSLAALLLSSVLTITADAATYYVGPHGNDGYSCSTATKKKTPKRTIRNGLNNCARNPGDVLMMLGGTYPEQLSRATGVNWPTGDSWNRPITIAGAPGETVLIKPGRGEEGALIQVQGGDVHHLVFDNLTIDGEDFARDGTHNCVKLDVGSHHIRIQNSTLRNCRGLTNPSATKGILAGGGGHEFISLDIYGNLGYGIYLTGANNLIERCRIHDNARYGLHIYDDHGGVDYNIIRNNRIYNNGNNSEGCWGGCYHAGMVVASGSQNQVYNNAVYGNANGGIQVGGTNTQVVNNTVYGNAREACMMVDSTNPVIRNNICYGNASDRIVGGSGTVSHNLLGTDPCFVDAGVPGAMSAKFTVSYK